MKAVMVDLETLGTSSAAPIIAIGACEFDLSEPGKIGRTFEAAVDMEDAVKHGDVEGGTIRWWLDQSEEARQAAIAGRTPLAHALSAFRAWLMLPEFDFAGGIWSNGAGFDVVILEHAFRRAGHSIPWGYTVPRDCRTLKALASGLVAPYARAPSLPERTPHMALSDAIEQARWTAYYWSALTNGRPAA